MVFETIIIDVLNKFLSKYIENLNESQLKVGLWGGDVILEKLVFKRGALDDLRLPIQTIYGHLNKLRLKIPWKNLYTAPVIASVEEFFILVVPNRDVKYDPIKEEQRLQDAKQYKLNKVEEAKLQEKMKDENAKDDTFMEKLVTQIIKNIQIKINSVQIRYEDRVTNPKEPFSFGISLDYFYVYTADLEWKEAIIQENVTKVNKVADMNSLAIYWNSNTHLFDENQYQKDFQNTISRNDEKPQHFRYILEPINSLIHLKLNSKPELDNYSIPKMSANIKLEKLALGISAYQYSDLIKLIESLMRFNRASRYRKYRPHLSSYKGHYKSWWKFAYTCINEERNKGWHWSNMLKHRIRCRKYTIAYRSKLTSKKITKQLENEINQLERELDVFNIVLIRKQVELEVEKTEHRILTETKEEKGWFSGWWGGVKPINIDPNNVLKTLENSMTPNEKEKLYQAIGYAKNQVPPNYPASYVDKKVDFNMKSFQIQILSTQLTTSRVIQFKLSDVNLMVKQRPVDNGFKVMTSILRVTVFGLKQKKITPMLVLSKEVTSGSNFLDLLFEMNPIHQKGDNLLRVKLMPLQIVYDSQTLQRVIDVFKTNDDKSTLQQIQARLENVRNLSATGLQYAIERRISLELKVDIKSSYIILPRNGLYTQNEDVLVVNLGRMTINTFPKLAASSDVRTLHNEGVPENLIMKHMISQSYDKFFLNLDDMQVLIALKGEDWRPILEGDEVTQLHILEPLYLSVVINKCLIKDDTRMPLFKITSYMPKVTLNITQNRLLHCLSLISSIPFLKEDEEEIQQIDLDLSTSNSVADFNIDSKLEMDVEETDQNVTTKTNKEVEKDMVQITIVNFTFAMDDLTISILHEDKHSASIVTPLHEMKKMLLLVLNQLDMDMVKRTFDMDITVLLTGVAIDAFDDKRVVRLIETPKSGIESELLSITLIIIDPRSPEFNTKDEKNLKFLQVTFSTLYILVHQEVSIVIIQYVQAIKDHLKEVQRRSALRRNHISKLKFGDVQQMVVQNLREEQKGIKKGLSVHKDTKPTHESNTLKLQATLNNLKIGLATSTTSIAEIIISGCKVQTVITEKHNNLKVNLKTVQVLDLYAKSCHTKALSTVGHETFSLEVTIHNPENQVTSTHRDLNNYMTINAKISCIRIVYLNRFVLSVLAFYNNLKIVQTILLGNNPQNNSLIRDRHREVLGEIKHIKFSVDIDAPICFVPLNSNSMDAIMLNFGNFTIDNQYRILHVTNEFGYSAVIDEFNIKLENFKIERVRLNKVYKVINHLKLIQPISFVLEVKKNLSSIWHTCVPEVIISAHLGDINVILTDEDYKMLMCVLNENFYENYTGPTARASNKAEETLTESDCDQLIFKNEEMSHQIAGFGNEGNNRNDSPKKINLKLVITMDSFNIYLFMGGATILDNVSKNNLTSSLLKFTLNTLSFQGLLQSNGNLQLSFRIIDCYLDDMRKGRENKDNRYMEKKYATQYDTYTDNQPNFPLHGVIDFTYVQTNAETSVDILLHSLKLILNLEFCKSVLHFFNSYEGNKNVTQREQLSQSSSKPLDGKIFVLNMKLDKTEITVVENVDDENNALITNVEILTKIRMFDGKMILNTWAKHLQVYCCSYDTLKRRETTALVLRKCSISMIGLKPNDSGLKLDICLTEVRLALSSTTISLLQKFYNVMLDFKDDTTFNTTEQTDYSNIWEAREFLDTDFWYTTPTNKNVRVTKGQRNELKVSVTNTNQHMCVVSAPSIILTIDAGEGHQTTPLFLIQIKLEIQLFNWSRNLFISNNIGLQMAYYNNYLALWEPFIEPVERTDGGNSTQCFWELKVEIKINNSKGSRLSLSEQSEESANNRTPMTSIHISSMETLEVTITKTSLNILKHLHEVLNMESTSVPISTLAPYIVKNISGLSLTIVLGQGPFKLLLPGDRNKYSEVKVYNGARVALSLIDDEEAHEGHLMPKLNYGINMETQDTSERFLSIRVYINTQNCILDVPIFRADKRYFSLKYRNEVGDQWGLVMDVKTSNGSTVILVRSIIQIHNHLQHSMNIYYLLRQKSQCACKFIGTVNPDEDLYLPLNSIYTPTRELVFSTKGYEKSNSFIWKDVETKSSNGKLLQCSVKDEENEKKFYIKVMGFCKEIFIENTSHYTTDSIIYNIHLHSAVVIKNFLPINIEISSKEFQVEEMVEAGGHLQIVNAEPGKSMIMITIPNYLGQIWSTAQEVPWTKNTFVVLKFTTQTRNETKSLDLQIHTKETNGIIFMSLYCQYWIVNKTGQNISYRQADNHDNIIHHNESNTGQILFSFWATLFRTKKMVVKIGNAEWSQKFSLSAVGSSSVVTCKDGEITYKISVNIQLTSSGLTQLVTFTPYYILVNNAMFNIKCHEVDQPDDQWISIATAEYTPFWPSTQKIKKLQLCMEGSTEVSTHFTYSSVHATIIRMANKYGGVLVDVHKTDAAVYITFWPYKPGLAPALLINHTDLSINYWEKASDVITLSPQKMALFTWNKSKVTRTLSFSTSKSKQLSDNLEEDGFHNFSSKSGVKVYCVSFFDSNQRTIFFTSNLDIAERAQSISDLGQLQTEITLSIQGIGLSLINNFEQKEIIYACITSSDIVWESVHYNNKYSIPLTTNLSNMIEEAYVKYENNLNRGLTANNTIELGTNVEINLETKQMIRPAKIQLQRTCKMGIWIQIKLSNREVEIRVKLNRLQIDNQLPHTTFPIMFAPVVHLSSYSPKPFVDLCILQRVKKGRTEKHFKYFKVAVQEFYIKLDMMFVNAIMALLEIENVTEQKERTWFLDDLKLAQKPMLEDVFSALHEDEKTFYNIFHLSPLTIHLSFTLSTSQEKGEQQTNNFLTPIFYAVGVTFTDIHDVVLKLADFERKNTILTNRQLMAEVRSHYTAQFLKQAHAIILGLSLIGNPWGLLMGLERGVKDFVYEPCKGAILGPEEFCEGLVLGTCSLLGCTVGGIAGAISHITYSIGTGLAALSFDQEYQRKRVEAMVNNPPSMYVRIAHRSKGLVMGVVDGVSGVILKPIAGARLNGVRGFMKGMGHGTIGLVTRPVVGVVDFASDSLRAVQKAMDMNQTANRVRPPRHILPDGHVRGYFRAEAEGSFMLNCLEKGRFVNTDKYVYHVSNVNNSKDTLMLTNTRILYVKHRGVWGNSVLWKCNWTLLKQPIVKRTGILVTVVQKSTILRRPQENDTMIIITNRKQKMWLTNKIKELIEAS